jgi:hypothetical protein
VGIAAHLGTKAAAARRYVTQLGFQFGGPEQVAADLEALARQEARRLDAPGPCEVFLGASVIRP